MPIRVTLLAVLALAGGFWLGVPGGGALAEPSPSPSSSAPAEQDEPSPTPCPVPINPCPRASVAPSPSPSPSGEPTPTAQPTPTRSAAPTPKSTRSRRPSRSPRPDPTFSEPTDSGSAVTATLGVGGVAADKGTPKAEKASSGGSDDIDRLLGLVLLVALALGFAGATGLYVTRHRPAH